MRVLLGFTAPLAAIAVAATPALAEPGSGPTVQVHGGGPSASGPFEDVRWGGGERDRRGNRGVVVGGWGWGERLTDNRSWEPDSYNDWWHDKPWRSYPRWVTSTTTCERMWWGGGAWRCGW